VSLNSFKSVAERIRQLETERKNLLLEIDELKKMADSKAKALESEVSMLRDEVRSLRMILGGTELEPETEPKKKPSRR
jgi:regulator of replication initiation timing